MTGAASWTLGVGFGTSFTTAAVAVDDRIELLEIDRSRCLRSTVYSGSIGVGRAGLGEAAPFADRAERLPKRRSSGARTSASAA